MAFCDASTPFSAIDTRGLNLLGKMLCADEYSAHFHLLENVALTTFISSSLCRLSFIAALCVRLLKILSLDDVKIIRLDDL